MFECALNSVARNWKQRKVIYSLIPSVATAKTTASSTTPTKVNRLFVCASDYTVVSISVAKTRSNKNDEWKWEEKKKLFNEFNLVFVCRWVSFRLSKNGNSIIVEKVYRIGGEMRTRQTFDETVNARIIYFDKWAQNIRDFSFYPILHDYLLIFDKFRTNGSDRRRWCCVFLSTLCSCCSTRRRLCRHENHWVRCTREYFSVALLCRRLGQ